MPSGVELAEGSRVDGEETGKKMQGGQENFSAPTEGRGRVRVENTQDVCVSSSVLKRPNGLLGRCLWSAEKLFAQLSRAIDFYLCQNGSSRFALQETENLQRLPIGHSLDALSGLLGRHTFIHLYQLP